jgi:broad specificity phosphatase PhoE
MTIRESECTFLLIRHGMTDVVGRKLTGRRPGVVLNESGHRQVRDLAAGLRGLKATAIYSSPLERAMETAKALGEVLGLEVVSSDRLLEVDFGGWEGLTLAELSGVPAWNAFNRMRSHFAAPSGEHMLDIQRRMAAEIEELRQRHAGGVVILVSHGDVIRVTLAHYLGIPLDLFLRLEVSPASVSVVQVGAEEIRVPVVNATIPLLAPIQY